MGKLNMFFKDEDESGVVPAGAVPLEADTFNEVVNQHNDTDDRIDNLTKTAIDTTLDGHDEEVVLIKSKNILPLNSGDLIFNKYIDTSTGVINSSTSGNYYASEKYISFSKYAGKTITLSQGLEIAYYKKDMSFTKIVGRNDNRTQVLPNDIEYIRIDCYKDNINSMQINLGDTLLPYENEKSTIYANGEKYSDTVNIGPEPNNAGVHFEVSNNLTQVELGGYSQSNGSKITDNNIYRSANFIKITTNKYTLSQNGNTDKTIRLFFYDSNMNFLSSSVSGGVITISNDNAKYFTWQGGIGTFNNTTNGIMLNSGTEPLPYEPYTTPSIKVNTGNGYKTIVTPNVYSTEEVVIGEFMGKTHYRRTILFGSLPNNGTKVFNFNSIGGLGAKMITSVKGFAYANSGSGNGFPIPYTVVNATTGVGLYWDLNGFSILTANDRSSYSAYIDVEYTKD